MGEMNNGMSLDFLLNVFKFFGGFFKWFRLLKVGPLNLTFPTVSIVALTDTVTP